MFGGQTQGTGLGGFGVVEGLGSNVWGALL